MLRRPLPAAAIAGIAIIAAWILFIALPRWYGAKPASGATPAAPAASPSGAERKINATLYFITEDGMYLVGVQREVPFGDQLVEQARRIVIAQLGAAPEPYATAVPTGTTLRGIYVSEHECDSNRSACKRDAFVDLSSEARTRHTGGALDELFTIYAIVNAVTVNLPTISRVQILVDGKEVDTLAGHVDLRHPLEKNLKWVRTEKEG
jgi:Sporulation and spore germination